MRIRESGMPEETYWESLFDLPLILDRLGVGGDIGDVAEVGCGYGTFTLPVARRIRGQVYALDVDTAMLARTRQRATAAGLSNVLCQECDALQGCADLPSDLDGCLLFNILHGEEPAELLAAAAGWIRPGGWVWVIHWRYDPSTPRGPSMIIRPRPEQIVEWAIRTGLLAPAGEVIDLPPWHYGLRFRRPATTPMPASARGD